LLALPLAVVAALALFLTWNGSSDHASAVGPSSVDLSINLGTSAEKPPNPGQPTPPQGCDSNAPTGNNCAILAGSMFTAHVQIESFKVPDGDADTVAGYGGWQVRVDWSGLTMKNRTGVGENVDPGCTQAGGDFAAESKGPGNTDLVGCAQGVAGDESTLTNIDLAQVDFNCGTAGTESKATITLNAGIPLDSLILDDSGGSYAETADETLVVVCQPPPGRLNINTHDSLNGTLLAGACYDIRDAVQVPIAIVCDNGAGDNNPAVGSIEVSPIPAGATLSVNQSTAPVKYAADPTKQAAGPFAAGQKITLDFNNVSQSGLININYTDNVGNVPVPGLCSEVDPGDVVVCDGDANDENPAGGQSAHNFAYGAYTVTFVGPLPAQRSLKPSADPQPCTIANGPAKADRQCKVSFSFNPITPFNLKLPQLQNLFLTSQGPKLAPRLCQESTNTATFTHELTNAPTSISPKGEAQTVGAFEFEVRFDQKWVCVNIEAGTYVTGNPQMNWTCFILDKDSSQLEGIARIGCVSKGKVAATNPSLQLARIIVRPQPEAYHLIIPNQDNRLPVQILNQDCELSDNQGHPIPKLGCDDSDVTLRFLEGDVVSDCAVDVLDQQALASRWLATVGNGLYNERMDLEPSGLQPGVGSGDGDIDIKDIQFVFGRHGSTCTTPWPAQGPVHSK
jgi:hypothetical protein